MEIGLIRNMGQHTSARGDLQVNPVGGNVHLVLPQKIGKVKITADVPADIVRDAVELIRNHA